jgi:hypothetical protein
VGETDRNASASALPRGAGDPPAAYSCRWSPVLLMEDDEGLHAAIAIEMVSARLTVPRLGEPSRRRFFWMAASLGVRRLGVRGACRAR